MNELEQEARELAETWAAWLVKNKQVCTKSCCEMARHISTRDNIESFVKGDEALRDSIREHVRSLR